MVNTLRKLGTEKRALSIVPPSAGGFTVPVNVSRLFWDIVLDDRLLEFITIYQEPNGRSNSIVVEDQQALGAWTGESAAITITDAVLANIEYSTLPKVCAAVISSEELDQDADSLGDDGREILNRILANRLRRAFHQAIAVGTGVNQPLGLCTAGNGLTEIVGAITNGTLRSLVRSIYATHLTAPSTAWFMNPVSWIEIVEQTDSNNWFSGDNGLNILGFPVILNAYAPDNVVVFGNLAYYGMKTIPDFVSGSVKNAPGLALNGQTAYYVYTRAMGKPVISASSDVPLAILRPA